jgi:hypothetical protein
MNFTKQPITLPSLTRDFLHDGTPLLLQQVVRRALTYRLFNSGIG